MANQGSTRMTTDQLRAMIAGGATRSELPTKASGSSVSSTTYEMSKAQRDRAFNERTARNAQTAAFRAAQTQTARTQAQARTAQMISVSENSNVMPNDAQTQKTIQRVNYTDSSKYVVHGANDISNNNVNPSSLYPVQPVIVTGQGQSSTVSGGLNVNANYNYATAMNEYQTANPLSSINLGESNEQNFTGGLSSVPKDNDVKTSLLGGDIQHQETDVNASVQPNNFSQSLVVAGSSIIPLAGIGLLAYFMGKRK